MGTSLCREYYNTVLVVLQLDLKRTMFDGIATDIEGSTCHRTLSSEN